MKLSHIRLLVKDYITSLKFYRDVMGFKVIWGDENTNYISFKTGGSEIALFPRNQMALSLGESNRPFDVERQSSQCLIIAVDNVDSTYDLLKSKGIETVNAPHNQNDWGIRCFHLYDPDGNLIEINKELSV
ncbi:VOC family protein [Scopulibacillus cellulosilyticus]|uniref:VOC family protein n=1 Tax=Scopulibacillus cellulosilyticus TaxID=2665665 RepID=A0ABW2PTA4_9BACL